MANHDVYIVGAGASCPFGMPTSNALKRELCENPALATDQLMRGIDSFRLPHGVNPVLQRVSELSTQFRFSNAQSIDRFLENRPDHVDLGKKLLAALLLPKEEEALHRWPHDGDWIGWLTSRYFDGTDDPADAHVTIITFNYDRLVEFGIGMMLANTRGQGANALELANRVPIIHVYGRCESPAAFKDGHITTRYTPKSRDETAKSIKIISDERTEDDDTQLALAREKLFNARRVVFLGFGYDRINLKRLGIYEGSAEWSTRLPNFNVFGTAFGLRGQKLKDLLRPFGPQRITPKHLGKPDQPCLSYLEDHIPND
ncbi:MAG: hypothetical protein KDA16_09975 [Phycisphaerales bacterium]|nr:hypothetical protein [Phycisphaerales bacterium]